jgi:hypothetical protein
VSTRAEVQINTQPDRELIEENRRVRVFRIAGLRAIVCCVTRAERDTAPTRTGRGLSWPGAVGAGLTVPYARTWAEPGDATIRPTGMQRAGRGLERS